MGALLLLIAAVEIPLSQVWGFDLPGTRDVAGVPLPEVDESKRPGQTYGSYRNQREQLVDLARKHLSAKPTTEVAMRAFVLPYKPALSTLGVAANRLAINLKMMRGGTFIATQRGLGQKSSVPPTEELTLVFFSHPCAYYLRLRKIEREDDVITVSYQFEPHYSPEVTCHYALIPLGKLPLGEYKVEMEQLPMEKKWQDAGFLRVHEALEQNLVCRPIVFNVAEKKPPAGPVLLSE